MSIPPACPLTVSSTERSDAAFLSCSASGQRIRPRCAGSWRRKFSACAFFAADVGGSVLVVSQFTLYGDVSHGRRPSFIGAARPDLAIPLYEQFLSECERLGFPPQHGEFGAYMQVTSENDGPVTLIVDTNDLK